MVKLALLWHMHQPYYEDLATGEHILPWVRLHATKDYWGMVAILDEFPGVRATFNLVPSLLVQLQAFAEDRAHDRHLSIGLKPADLLSDAEKTFLVANGFHAPVDRAIRPNPRYAELFERRREPLSFTVQELRDLQVWHKLVWMDPDWLGKDARLVGLVERGRDYRENDKQQLREVELELLRAVIPAYRAAAATGRIELSTSPFYHPILPLLCDTDAHLRAYPHSPIPRQLFRYPDDAREQLARSFAFHEDLFGSRPAGVWPSEGSVSDEVLEMLASQSITWTATDEEILARTLGRRLNAADLYRPYTAAEEKVRVLFRDHELSDMIGFAYQSWDATAAVADFLTKVRAAGRRFRDSGGGEEPIVSVILDGENAWEHYAGGGRPFLRTLYRALEEAEDIQTVTMTAAASAASAKPLPSIFPGSWINGDFYIWAGHRDDHRAWEQLAAARSMFESKRANLAADRLHQAHEELLIAEGSDWFWWYGDDHSSDHDREFDDLFRRHVRNVYRALGEPAPDELHRSNITTEVPAGGPLPLGILSQPSIDGRGANYLDWATAVDVPLGAGGGTMHRVGGHLVRAIKVAADLDRLYLRVEGPDLVRRIADGDVRLAVLVDGDRPRRVTASWTVADVAMTGIRFVDLHVGPGERLRFSLLVTDEAGHVIEQHPWNQPTELTVPAANHDAIHWLV